MLSIHAITIFPELFQSFLHTSLIQKARERNLLSFHCHQLRDFAEPPHFRVDDTPYGGGGGMLLKPEPLARAIQHVKQLAPEAPVLFLTPGGQVFKQEMAQTLAHQHTSLILLCGRYEGVDQRIIDKYVDIEVSIGDYILMGGELPAMVLSEALVRLKSEVLGNETSSVHESFSCEPAHGSALSHPVLEAPHYTRPAEFEGQRVPEVLLSGDHAKISQWKTNQSLARTRARRPDLIKES